MADISRRWLDGDGYRVIPAYHPAAMLHGTVDADLLVEDIRAAKTIWLNSESSCLTPPREKEG